MYCIGFTIETRQGWQREGGKSNQKNKPKTQSLEEKQVQTALKEG
jgi:hypothetical protein